MKKLLLAIFLSLGLIATPVEASILFPIGGGTGSSTLTGILKGNGSGIVQTAIPGTDYITSNLVTSVFSRIGAVIATAGDYTTTLVTEGTNLYFTTTRALVALTGQNVQANRFTATSTDGAFPSTFPQLLFTNATGTSATTSDFSSIRATFTTLAFASATGTSATTTNFAVTGQLSGCAQFNTIGSLQSTGSNCGGGSQTPWTSNIFANSFALQTVGSLSATSSIITQATSTDLFSTRANITTLNFTNATGTSATTTNLASTFATFPTLTFTNATGTNATTTFFNVANNLTVGNGTSTFGSGINIITGCFAIGGTCLSGTYSDPQARNAVSGLFPATTSVNTWNSLQTFTAGILSSASSTFQFLNIGQATSTDFFSTRANFTTLNFTNATGSSATTTSLNVGNILTGFNSIITQSTSTNLFATTLYITNGVFTGVTSTDEFATRENVTTLTFTSATGTNATTTNLTSTFGTFPTLTFVSATGTSATTSNLNANMLTALQTVFTRATSSDEFATRANFTTLTFTNATGTSATTTNLSSTFGTFPTLTFVSATGTSATTTNFAVGGQLSGCAQFNAIGSLQSTGSNCGAGSQTPWTSNIFANSFALQTVGSLSATSSVITQSTSTDLFSTRANITTLTFTSATGSSATTTNFASTFGTFPTLTFVSATGTSATTTNFAIGGQVSGCAQFNSIGALQSTGSNCGGAGSQTPWTSNIFANSFSLQTVGSLSATSSIITQSTSTDLFSTRANITTLNFTSATGTSATTSSFNVGNILTALNSVITQATSTNLFATTLYITNGVFTGSTSTDLFSTRANVTTLNFASATGTSATTSNFNVGNILTGLNSIITQATSTDLFSTRANVTTITFTNSTGTNATTTFLNVGNNMTVGNGTSTHGNGISLTEGCFAYKGTCLSTGGAGSQTPWTSNIFANSFSLQTVGSLSATSSIITQATTTDLFSTRANVTTLNFTNATGTSATTTSLNVGNILTALNSVITQASSTNLFSTTLYTTNGVFTGATSSDFFSTRATFGVFNVTSLTATSTINTGGLAIGTTTPDSTSLFEIGTSTPLMLVDKATGKIGFGAVNVSPSKWTFGLGTNININPNIQLVMTDTVDARLATCVNNKCVAIKSGSAGVTGGIYGFDYSAATAVDLNFQEFGAKVGLATATPWGFLSIIGSSTVPNTPLFYVATSTASQQTPAMFGIWNSMTYLHDYSRTMMGTTSWFGLAPQLSPYQVMVQGAITQTKRTIWCDAGSSDAWTMPTAGVASPAIINTRLRICSGWYFDFQGAGQARLVSGTSTDATGVSSVMAGVELQNSTNSSGNASAILRPLTFDYTATSSPIIEAWINTPLNSSVVSASTSRYFIGFAGSSYGTNPAVTPAIDFCAIQATTTFNGAGNWILTVRRNSTYSQFKDMGISTSTTATGINKFLVWMDDNNCYGSINGVTSIVGAVPNFLPANGGLTPFISTWTGNATQSVLGASKLNLFRWSTSRNEL